METWTTHGGPLWFSSQFFILKAFLKKTHETKQSFLIKKQISFGICFQKKRFRNQNTETLGDFSHPLLFCGLGSKA